MAQRTGQGKALRTERGQLYGRDPVGGAIDSGGYAGPKPAGTVAKTAFSGGDNGYESTKAWIGAGCGVDLF